jgi:hypothetical protein
LHSTSTSPISANTSISNTAQTQLQNGSRQNLYNSVQQFGAQNNLQQFASTSHRMSNSGSHSAGAIPRRNVRRGNSSTEEEQPHDKH